MAAEVFRTPEKWLGEAVSVVLVGAGGTGSEMFGKLIALHATLVALDHPGLEVRVIDADEVSPGNLGRQTFWPAELGRNKAICLVHRANVCHGLAWGAEPRMAVPDDAAFEGADLIISCTDSALFRYEMGRVGDGGRYHYGERLWLDCGNGRTGGQMVLGHLGRAYSGLRLPNVCDLFGHELAGLAEAERTQGKGEDSCSVAEAIRRQSLPVNGLAAITAQALLYRLLREGGSDWHGALFDAQNLSVDRLMIDAEAWACYGHGAEARKGVAA